MNEASNQPVARHPDLIAAVLEEIIDRRRNGERPNIEEYVEKYPQFREEIETHFSTIAFLEGESEKRVSGAPTLADAIARFPPQLQRVIYLRNFKNLKWAEISQIVGEPEMELRRKYASAIEVLLEQRSSDRQR